MWSNLHPSDKLYIKAIILLVIILALFAIIPQLGLILIGIAFLSFFFNKEDSNHRPYKEKVNYHSYLQSDKWKAKRSIILSRDRNRCVCCHSTHHLHVHHIHYGNLGNEEDIDLVTLCSKCHKELHNYHGKNAH